MVMGGCVATIGLWFYIVLDSIDKPLKIIFLQLTKYIFYSGCSKRPSTFGTYFRYFLSKQLHRRLSEPRCDPNLSTGVLVEDIWCEERPPHRPTVPEPKGGQKAELASLSLVLGKHVSDHPPHLSPNPGGRERTRINRASRKGFHLSIRRPAPFPLGELRGRG